MSPSTWLQLVPNRGGLENSEEWLENSQAMAQVVSLAYEIMSMQQDAVKLVMEYVGDDSPVDSYVLILFRNLVEELIWG